MRALASYLKVPEAVVGRPPSPDLIAGITDEMAMGITYDVLDQILAGLEHGVNHQEIAKALAVAESVVDGVAGLVTRAERLRQGIPAPAL